MSKLLVLMSTYNGEKYLSKQIDSILNQECNISIDILIRDDESTDNTIDICDRYIKENRNIKLIKGNNVGATQSFMQLVMEAPLEYDYYAFSDQDDYWESDKIWKAVNQLQSRNTKPAIYYSGQKIVDEALDLLSDHILDSGRSRFANFILNQTAGCTTVFNRQLLELLRIGGDIHPDGHDIWTFRVCCATGGDICIDPEGSILYRQHGSNVEGLNNSILGKIRRVPRYIKGYNSSVDANALLDRYANYISNKNKYLLTLIATSNNNIKSRFKLLASKDIQFHNPVLRIVFIIKVLMKKL